MKTLGMGVSSSLIAAAIVYWITDHRLIPTFVIAGAGIAGFLITHFLTKRPLPATTLPSVRQDLKQEVNPQVNISPQVNFSIGSSTAAAPAPAPEKKPEPRCNIKFLDVWYGEKEQMNIFSKFTGQSLSFATAKFENEAIKGQEVLTPTVKARAIYRRFDGGPILDLSNLPWVPGAGDAACTTFEASTPKYLLLFFLGSNKRFCRSVESVATRIAGRRQMISEAHDYEIKEPIASVEVQLLTDTQKVYSVLIHFVDSEMRLLPFFKGEYKEL